MKSHVDLLVETKAYYEKNSRSLKDGKCVYRDDNGNGCAVGRILPKAVGIELDARSGEMGVSVSHAIKAAVNPHRCTSYDGPFNVSGNPFTKRTTERIKKLNKDYSVNFLRGLQAFHDAQNFWVIEGGDNCLTSAGNQNYLDLLKSAKELDKKEMV